MPIPDFSERHLEELISLDGRTAVVTGGVRGIGLAIAKRLAEAGADIVIVDKDEDNCMNEALADFKRKSREVIGLKCDTRDREAMEHAAERAVDQFGGLDIWVNDAGIFPSTPVMEISEQEWAEVIGTNVTGVFHGARAAIPHLKKTGGIILNISSVTGLNGSEEYAHYSASKFAVRGMTATLAKELGKHNRARGMASILLAAFLLIQIKYRAPPRRNSPKMFPVVRPEPAIKGGLKGGWRSALLPTS